MNVHSNNVTTQNHGMGEEIILQSKNTLYSYLILN